MESPAEILRVTLLVIGTIALIFGVRALIQMPNKKALLRKHDMLPRHGTVRLNLTVASIAIVVTLVSLFFYVLLG